MTKLKNRIDIPVKEPPNLNKKKPSNRYLIIPDIRYMSCPWAMSKTYHDNICTIHWHYMCKIDAETREFIESTHVNTRVYYNWLETYETSDNIPPHIFLIHTYRHIKNFNIICRNTIPLNQCFYIISCPFFVIVILVIFIIIIIFIINHFLFII